MNEMQALQLINAVNEIAKEVAENRRQINELIQEVGKLKAMQKPFFNGKSPMPIECQTFNPYIKITGE